MQKVRCKGSRGTILRLIVVRTGLIARHVLRWMTNTYRSGAQTCLQDGQRVTRLPDKLAPQAFLPRTKKARCYSSYN